MDNKRHKRKLAKSASQDVESTVTADSDPNTSVDTASQPSPVPLKREGFICSTSHNAHLDEDYLADKSQLFGRQLPTERTPSPGKSRSSSRLSSASPSIRETTSEKSLRRFFKKSASVDTQSLRSAGRGAGQRRSARRGSLLPVSEEGTVNGPQATVHSTPDRSSDTGHSAIGLSGTSHSDPDQPIAGHSDTRHSIIDHSTTSHFDKGHSTTDHTEMGRHSTTGRSAKGYSHMGYSTTGSLPRSSTRAGQTSTKVIRDSTVNERLTFESLLDSSRCSSRAEDLLRNSSAAAPSEVPSRRKNKLRKSFSEDSHSVVSSVTGRRNAHAELTLDSNIGCAVALVSPAEETTVASASGGRGQSSAGGRFRGTSVEPSEPDSRINRFRKFASRPPRKSKGASAYRSLSPGSFDGNSSIDQYDLGEEALGQLKGASENRELSPDSLDRNSVLNRHYNDEQSRPKGKLENRVSSPNRLLRDSSSDHPSDYQNDLDLQRRSKGASKNRISSPSRLVRDSSNDDVDERQVDPQGRSKDASINRLSSPDRLERDSPIDHHGDGRDLHQSPICHENKESPLDRYPRRGFDAASVSGSTGHPAADRHQHHRPDAFRHSRQVSLVSRTSGMDAVTLIEFNRLVRRDTVVRQESLGDYSGVSNSAAAPVLYKRYSLTHPMQSAMSDDKGGTDPASPLPPVPTTLERPQRSKRTSATSASTLKRDSIIHPVGSRPPMGRMMQDDLYQPILEDGRFRCPWTGWVKPSWWDALKYSLTSKDSSNIPSAKELDKTLPIVALNEESLKNVPRQGMRVTWLGHSTVLVQFDKLTILTDPIFSERASPLGFVGPKRYRPVPGTIYDLPRIDAVLISHNHYDHLDYNSVLLLNARFGADLQWFVPLGLERWMHGCGCQSVTELSWWEESCLPHTRDTTFVFTPAQHWCKRSAKDDNMVLWGSFCVISPRYRFFFAGDTGYCDAFRQIGLKYGPFDLAAIPIGAYEPRWFMQTQHIDPVEAVKIHKDIRASQSLGIHWGTFKLTHEHYLEPPQKMEESAKESGLEPNEFFVMKHGESRLMFA